MALSLPIVSKFDPKGVTDAQNAFGRLGKFANNVGPLIAGAFAIGAVGAVAFAGEAIKAAAESDRISRGLENAIKNAGVFGNTDADIHKATTALEDHAQKLGELIGVDDEVLTSIERTWMAVPELAGLGTAGIENLMKVTADVAAGTGKDIESIGGAFIKIAGNEETAMGKLARMGIVFTDQQKETYQGFLDANDQIGAQKYLIDELGKTYQGSAEAMASPLDRVSVIFGNIMETIGTYLMPAVSTLADYFQKVSDNMKTNKDFQDFLKTVGDNASAMVDAFIGFTDWYLANQDLANAIATGIGIIATALGIATVAVWAFNIALYANPIGLIVAAIVIAVGILVAAIWLIASNWDAIVSGMKTAWDVVVYGIGTAWATVANGVIDGINFIIGAFNGLLDVWNAILGTDWHVNLIAHVDTPNMPASMMPSTPAQTYRPGGLKLASGGIVLPRPGGTMATIGEGGQAEAVIPLDKLGSIMGGKGGGSTYVINVNGGLSTSAEIGRAVVDSIKKFERVSGPVFVGA